MSGVEIDGDTLLMCGKRVEFVRPIEEALVHDDLAVVLLTLTGEDYPGVHRNVIAVDEHGDEAWRIEKNPDKVAGQHDSYTGIWEEDGNLWAYNASGMAYKVDAETGAVVDSKLMK